MSEFKALVCYSALKFLEPQFIFPSQPVGLEALNIPERVLNGGCRGPSASLGSCVIGQRIYYSLAGFPVF